MGAYEDFLAAGNEVNRLQRAVGAASAADMPSLQAELSAAQQKYASAQQAYGAEAKAAQAAQRVPARKPASPVLAAAQKTAAKSLPKASEEPLLTRTIGGMQVQYRPEKAQTVADIVQANMTPEERAAQAKAAEERAKIYNPDYGTVLGYIYKYNQKDPETGETHSITSVTPAEGAAKVPIYASFYTMSLDGKPLSKDEQFQLGAKVAGADDAKDIDSEHKTGNGVINSHFFSADVRKAAGLPSSFDMIRGINPTDQAWGSSNWQQYNPKSSSVFQDVLGAAGEILSNPITQIALAVMSGGTSELFTASTSEMVAEMAAQEAAQQAMEQAVTNAFADAGVQSALGSVSSMAAQGAMPGLAEATRSLSNVVSSQINESLANMGIKGMAADAVKNAGLNTAKALITGQDPLKAALSGAVAPIVNGSMGDILKGLDPDMHAGIANAITSAAKNGAQAAVMGGDIGTAIMAGAATSGVSTALNSSGLLNGLDKPAADAASAALKAATAAAITGGDVEQAALLAGATAGVGSAVGSAEQLKDVDPMIRDMATSAAKAVTSAAITGGDLATALTSGALSGAMSGLGKPSAQPQATQVAEGEPSFEDVIAQLQDEYETPTENAIDAGALGGEAQQPKPATTAAEDYIDAGKLLELPYQNALNQYATPTEQWVDEGRLMYDPLSLEILGTGDEEAPPDLPIEEMLAEPEYATPTEQAIDEGQLVYSPLPIEILGTGSEAPTDVSEPPAAETPAQPIEYATPTERAIDEGQLVYSPLALEILGTGSEEGPTPTESWIDQAGLTAPREYATPTEEAIDRGTLGGLESTATEDAIDRGALGGTPETQTGGLTGGTSGGTTAGTAGGARTPAGGTTATRTAVSPLQQLAAAQDTVTTQSVPAQQMLQTRETSGGFQSPLQEFLKQVSTGSYVNRSEPERAQAMPALSYFSYGQPDEIDSILGGQSYMAQGGLAVPLMAAGGTRYGANAKGGLNVVHHAGKARVDFRHGDAVTGAGDGQSDDIPAMLADGEFVFPADVVSALGNGSTKAGSDKLYEMMHEIRAHARSSRPKELPPPAKNPLDYLKDSRKSRR